MLGYIYAIKNTVNNKIYIGQTRGLLKIDFLHIEERLGTYLVEVNYTQLCVN